MTSKSLIGKDQNSVEPPQIETVQCQYYEDEKGSSHLVPAGRGVPDNWKPKGEMVEYPAEYID
jgi:hypothetical protein